MNAAETFRYEIDANERPSEAVVLAVAAVDNCDPLELTPPLYHVVDPDALDALFAPIADPRARSNGHVVFDYRGHEITIRSDRQIEVRTSR
jgi:hypothetical protein